MTGTVIYTQHYNENIIIKKHYILSLAAVFLRVVAWRTRPQKEFIQSRADAFMRLRHFVQIANKSWY